MVRNLREAESAGRFAKKRETYLKPAALVCDEVGYLSLSRAEGNMVFQLVSRRYEPGSIILTSYRTFAEMDRVFGDEVLASTILDRLLHHAEVISTNGPSYRLKDHMIEQREGGDGRLQSRRQAPADRHVSSYAKGHDYLTAGSTLLADRLPRLCDEISRPAGERRRAAS